MNFVEIAVLDNQVLIITPRQTGQIVRFNGTDRVTVGLSPIRLVGSGPVLLSSGWWDNLLITDSDYDGPYFDGDSPSTENSRTSWEGTPGGSQTLRETRTLEDIPWTDEQYRDHVDSYRRMLHDVTRISGPLVQAERVSNDGVHVGRVVEFTLRAHNPHVYGIPREVELAPSLPTVVQDVLYNLAPRPNGEVPGAAVVAATNFVLNPSLEVNATGWVGSVAAFSGSAPASYFTSGRVVGELSAAAPASFRARLLGNGSTAASGVANLAIANEVDISARPAGSRVSVTMWGAVIVLAGQAASTVQAVTLTAEWLTSAGVLINAESIDGSAAPADFGGRVYSRKSMLPPANAARVRLTLRAQTSWASSATPANNSDIRLYGDALAVTVP